MGMRTKIHRHIKTEYRGVQGAPGPGIQLFDIVIVHGGSRWRRWQWWRGTEEVLIVVVVVVVGMVVVYRHSQ